MGEKQKITKRWLKLVLLVFLVLTLGGLGCKSNSCQKKITTPPPPINLTFWGLWDGKDVFDPMIEKYRQTHPNVYITYKKYNVVDYEKTVTEALAAGRGPDIWMIHNTWLPRHKDKLAAAPDDLQTYDQFQEAFADVVASDFTDNKKIYGAPLSVDTLALYYNVDLMNTAHIVSPPANWEQFVENVKTLTKLDSAGNIIQSGAAIGTASNINRATDLLTLLMLQNGTQMTDNFRRKATFAEAGQTQSGKTYYPGMDALRFYTDFANPRKTVYTWNPTMAYSTDAFNEEKVAMMFSYSYQKDMIKSKAPRLNFAVARMPQVKDNLKEVSYANYWGNVVSASSVNQKQAWDFLLYLAKKEGVEYYTKATKRPAARKDVIENQKLDPEMKIFAEQALTAKSWYEINASSIEDIFGKMIDKVVLGEADAQKATKEAQSQVSQLMGK